MAFRSRRCLLAQLLSRGSLQRSFASESTVHRQIPRVDWKVEQAEQIQQQLLQKDEPAVLAGALQRWPLSRWKLEHLRKLGDVIVPMELSWSGADYRDLFRTHTSMSDPEPPQLKKYETDVELPLFQLLDHIEQSAKRKPGERRGKDVRMYLAQKDIEDVLPQLTTEMIGPLPLPLAQERLYRRVIWLGPAGTVTPLHRDPYFNLFCQIFGAKRIQLVHPSQSSDVQPFSSPIVLRNTSEIDMDEVDARVGDNKTGQPWDVTLQPGEILYIPKGWWHHIQATEPSLSVSCWWT